MFQERVLEGQGEGGVGEGDTVTLVSQEGGDQGHHTIQVIQQGDTGNVSRVHHCSAPFGLGECNQARESGLVSAGFLTVKFLKKA